MTFDIAAADSPRPATPALPSWLEWISGQGEMGARVAAFDWAATSLGPITAWPPAARSAVVLCLGSLFPMSVRLGDELAMVYNDACREIFGDERFSSALGRASSEVWPEAATQTAGLIERVIASGRPFFATDRSVYLNRAVPGEECYFTLCYSAIVEDDGRTSGVLSTFVETTGRVLADRRLRTIERLGRELAAGRTDAELAGLAMEVLADNAADHPAGALYRTPRPGDAAPVALASFGDPIDCEEAGELVQSCFAGDPAAPAAADGAPFSGLHAFGVREPEQDVPTHVLVIRHPSAQAWDSELEGYLSLVAGTLAAALLTQAELWAERRMVAKAAALDAAKSAFFAGVSHELRTPLALIAAPVEDILDREHDLSPKTRRDLALVQGNVARLARLVEAMLDFSRMEAGRLVPHLQSTDVAVMVHGLAASFSPVMERAGLDFVVDVPELARRARIDRDFLERIVLNLLSNAAKFTPSGTITLRLSETGDTYEIEVTDTGPGINPADHDRVFARFERLSTPAGGRAAIGAGIGLAMVRQLTELLGGQVGLDSSLGSGSRFTIRLPFAPPAPSGTGQSITPRRVTSFLSEFEAWSVPPASEPQGDRPTLAVVEDDAQLARFLADSLTDSYAVKTFPDGEAALAAIREQRPEIVLTDLAMPNLNGLGLIRAIREDPALRDLPVVLLSARSADVDAAAGLEEGADDYIAKPFTLVDLRARLAANLERARERMMDAAWRRAVITAIHDGLVIFDADGLVLEMNQAFSDLLGYTMEDGPIRPPYPWWPTEDEDAEALAAIRESHQRARNGEDQTGEFRFYRRDRQPIWVRSTDAPVPHHEKGLSANVRTIRDVTRERAARERRIAGAQVSADFAAIDDLDALLAVAEHGLGVLFDGGSTVQLRLDDRRELLISAGSSVTAEDLADQVRAGLAGEPSPDTTSLRPGILLAPRSSATWCRAWVQFPRPRRIGPDEMIVADLLAQAFALAVDRIVAAQKAADREANLQQAVESHRLIGQAIGILVERHRLLPGQAFDRLRATSQNRNLKLREVARRVVETGAEPEQL